MFKDETIITRDNDIFEGAITQSPYLENQIEGKEQLKLDDGIRCISSSKPEKLKGIYLYCFNVGQGDTLLLILPNGNVYLIDTNIYSYKLSDFISNVKGILKKHELDETRIKALLITHKHLDHIRGASLLLKSEEFQIKNFLINLDYIHSTKAVQELYISARNYIPTWINVNRTGVIYETSSTIHINNPDIDTSTFSNAPDINDSSVSLYITYKNNAIYLTGDASHPIILSKFLNSKCLNSVKSILKVSHHGSTTGTNKNVLSLINPSYAFISAGYNKRFNHPDQQTLQLLQSHKTNPVVSISKFAKQTIEYEITGSIINKH